MSVPHLIGPDIDIVQRYLRDVTRVARRFAHGDSDAAADLAQEAWLAILRVPRRRLSEARYIRTVIFRAMSRWHAREAAQRGVHPVRLRVQAGGKKHHIYRHQLHLRESGVHLSLDTPHPPRRAAA
jgi:DNA-directed RNA polymerase specialized sigma24 family protein